jgi:hypothetical protein
MTTLVTLATAKLHLRVTGTDEDALITIYLEAAEQGASDFLNRTIYATTTGSDLDGVVINAAITAAILLILGHLFANREAVMATPGIYAIELPMGARSLLQPYRIGMGV